MRVLQVSSGPKLFKRTVSERWISIYRSRVWKRSQKVYIDNWVVTLRYRSHPCPAYLWLEAFEFVRNNVNVLSQPTSIFYSQLKENEVCFKEATHIFPPAF